MASCSHPAGSGRDNALWLQCWRDRQTGFHLSAVNPLLPRFWPGLNLAPRSRVFVPLCGKSLDMLWLASEGFEVVGIELSPIAVRAFFKEQRLRPVRSQAGAFTLWQAGPISILCGDFFALTEADLRGVDAVYDRAALGAFPTDIRQLYVAHLRAVLPSAGKVFLLTAEVPEAGESRADIQGADAEIVELYEAAFEIELTHVEHAIEAGPDAGAPPEEVVHKVYRLVPRLAEVQTGA